MEKREILKNCLFEELPYRKSLGIDSNVQLEIAAGLQNRKDIEYLCNEDLSEKGYAWQRELTIKKSIPFEIVTPKLIDEATTWEDLLLLSKRMQECDLKFDESALHVNLDSHLSEKDLMVLLKLFAINEDVIYHFSRGMDDSLRDLKYANSIRFNMKAFTEIPYELRQIIIHHTWNYVFGISLKSKTWDARVRHFHPIEQVEFRTPNGCDDAWLWQNYVNTFYHFLKYVEKADLEKVEYDFQNIKHPTKHEDYEMANINLAIEFANTIFDNDLDKLYFMRHYIGKDREKIIDEYRLAKR